MWAVVSGIAIGGGLSWLSTREPQKNIIQVSLKDTSIPKLLECENATAAKFDAEKIKAEDREFVINSEKFVKSTSTQISALIEEDPQIKKILQKITNPTTRLALMLCMCNNQTLQDVQTNIKRAFCFFHDSRLSASNFPVILKEEKEKIHEIIRQLDAANAESSSSAEGRTVSMC